MRPRPLQAKHGNPHACKPVPQRGHRQPRRGEEGEQRLGPSARPRLEPPGSFQDPRLYQTVKLATQVALIHGGDRAGNLGQASAAVEQRKDPPLEDGNRCSFDPHKQRV
ncbi:MAG TPA: hypothetical protein VF995_01035 [Actinomycetota bacterium]